MWFVVGLRGRGGEPHFVLKMLRQHRCHGNNAHKALRINDASNEAKKIS